MVGHRRRLPADYGTRVAPEIEIASREHGKSVAKIDDSYFSFPASRLSRLPLKGLSIGWRDEPPGLDRQPAIFSVQSNWEKTPEHNCRNNCPTSGCCRTRCAGSIPCRQQTEEPEAEEPGAGEPRISKAPKKVSPCWPLWRASWSQMFSRGSEEPIAECNPVTVQSMNASQPQYQS